MAPTALWRKVLPDARRHLRAAVRGDQGVGALLIRGASAGVLLTGFNTLATFGTAVLLARALGAEHYGIYAYAISWITLLGVFAKAGIDQVMVRNIAVYHQAHDWAHIRGMLRFGLVLVSAAGVLCALGAAALAGLLHADAPAMRNALWIACLLLPLQALAVPLGAAQSGLHQVVNAQLPGLLVVPLIFLLGIGGAYLLPGSAGFTADQALAIRIGAVGIGLGVAASLLHRGLRRAGRPASLPTPAYEAGQWWRSAMPMVLMGSMFMVNANADILMLGAMAGAREAGVYKVATRGAELLTLSIGIISTPLGPVIARLSAAGRRQELQRVIRYVAWLAFLPTALLGAFFLWKGNLFLSIFGTEFAGQDANSALAILTLGQLIHIAVGPVGLLLLMSGREKDAALSLMTGAVLNVLLNAVLIPMWGVEGAAVATALSTSVFACTLLYFVVRHMHLNPTILPFGANKC